LLMDVSQWLDWFIGSSDDHFGALARLASP
jgi:hypothetical protein